MVDLDGLLRRLRDAGVKAVSPGLIRFASYPESRAMFEEKTGRSTVGLETDESGTVERLRRSIRDHRFEDPDRMLHWNGQDERESSLRACALDGYV
jgi:hypothetical protein